mgnify:FL=1
MKNRDGTTRKAKDGGRRAGARPEPQGSAPQSPFPPEEAYFQDQEKYRLLAEKAPLGIAVIGRNGRYHYLNPKFVDIFGYTLEDIPTGREWLAKAYPDEAYRRQVISDWKLYVQESRGGEAEPRLFTVTCKDGSAKVIKFRAVPLEGGEQFVLYEDITELQEAKDSLKASELKYRTLVEQIPAITYIAALDAASTTSYVSPQVEALLGFSPADYEANPGIWLERLHPDDRERVLAAVARCHETGEPLVSEYRMLARDGRTVWFRDEARLVPDASGRPLFLQGVMLDITAPKQAEEKLLQAREEWERTFDAIPDLIMILDNQYRIVRANRALAQRFGCHPEDLVGRLCYQALYDLEAPHSPCPYALLLSQGRTVQQEFYDERSQSHFLITASPLFDPSGRVVGSVQVGTEITQCKRAQEALRKNEERYRLIAENVSDVIWTTDLDLRFTYVSPSVQQVLGFTPEEIIGRTMGEFLPPASLARALEVFSEEMAREKAGLADPKRSRTLWIEELHKNGALVWTEVKAGFIRGADQQPRGILGVTRDITQRQEAEKTLRESEEKLRSLSCRLLTAQEEERRRLALELHDVVGHDLLLLKLQLEALEDRLAPKPGSFKTEVRPILRALEKSVRNVRRLCQDLSPGDLEDLGLTAALHFLVENFAAARKLTWKTELDNLDGLFELPVQTAIYRMVQEALTNIGKHARARHLWLRARRTGTQVDFTIRDDGRGFDVAQTRAGKKTLGLPAMEERINILGGAFNLESEKKAGTKISFTIPISGAKPHCETL